MASSNTVIIGAGIIGCSTAYHLANSKNTPAQNIHLVEASENLFSCASGYAGGFLAADWFAPTVAPLGALSFKLHKQLAEKHNGREKWGYTTTITSSLSHDSEAAVDGSGEDWLHHGTSRLNAASGISGESQEDLPRWLNRAPGSSIEVISTKETTAQVDPLRLSRFLLDTILAQGVQLHHPAKAISISKDLRETISSVCIVDNAGTETDIPCTRLIITSGAWTPKVFKTLLPLSHWQIPIKPLAGHSLLLRSSRWSRALGENGCHALFATDSSNFSPEIFARLDGELYIAGLNTATLPLPNLASDAQTKPASIAELKEVAQRLLGLPDVPDSDLEIVRESLCFRPVTAGGKPIIGRVPDTKLGGVKTSGGGEGGVFIAAGHGAWGIAQSLGTGLVVAELVEGRETSCDVERLAPS